MSHVTQWTRYPHPKSKRLYIARATELNDKNYKLGQACVTNWGINYKLGQPLLQNRAAILNWAKFIANWGWYYKLGQSLQTGA